MNEDILKRIDEEIARLQQARTLLAGGAATTSPIVTPKRGVRKRRKLSAEARRKIAEAQKRRWAKARGKAGS